MAGGTKKKVSYGYPPACPNPADVRPLGSYGMFISEQIRLEHRSRMNRPARVRTPGKKGKNKSKKG